MPAILKGWVDRVYAFGFAYGVGEMNEKNFFDRYGQGNMAGKRAMVVTLTGGSAEHYSARGINGVLHDVRSPACSSRSLCNSSEYCPHNQRCASFHHC